MTRTFPRSVPARALLALALLGGVARAEPSSTRAGRAHVYSQLGEESLEAVTPPERILAVTRGNVAPTEIWRALEHGERVECLSCIPAVSRLLHVEEEKTREIAAWWLRRRVFGVFGAGQIYPRLLETVASDPPEVRRSRAAEAVGEFLAAAGVPVVARAAVTDSSPVVRAASVRALERLNSEGPAGELGAA
ncbi:MAG: HEAT repeat domain-containing protein, partial [Deltaproteobacteria bacterium]|nr:HEAT repeat domain-containing protein [Deltaproteobacteria bacterium]